MDYSGFKKYFLNFCGAILIFLFINILFLFTQQVISIDQLFSNQIIGNLLSTLCFSIIIFILVKVYNDGIINSMYKKVSINSLLHFNKKNMLLLLILLFIAFAYVWLLLSNVFKEILINNGSREYNLEYNFLFKMILVAPILEELYFRGIFNNIAINSLKVEKLSDEYFIAIINAILFSLLHYNTFATLNISVFLSLLMAFLTIIVYSISFWFIYIKTKDIKYNIILHILVNLTLNLVAIIF
ncbi:CPBP family intramembrane glutamic endopeptidase [Metaclostridioides mangenotii]|uniref:Membrane protease YdiL (CAAX protease family) n=1 Tax=Metaclostridioides mangenotii TaxID=1540 RepID=A0ABS4E7Y9_9FIRM|nr:CPBP family intramembrane glutamic endopeptidase [Clostridioides mangenotii]MBP1854049.1 membrane protease YdiL (CAAX protease family) [Clostridioides mangenotii]